MSNSFGNILKLTSFGESHGLAIGGVLDGVPSNVSVSIEEIQRQLDRRKPGQSKLVTQRKESDKIQILSGIFEGKTTGMPIGFVLWNEDQKSKDYSHLRDNFRPSHADYTYQQKYGHRDYRGGGRSSARETATRVAAGAIAQQILKQVGIEVTSYVSSVGVTKMAANDTVDFNEIEKNLVRCPNAAVAKQMEDLIMTTKKAGDTVGGVISTLVTGTPVGLGEPVYNKLNASLAQAMLSINAVKGFELGSGFQGATMNGSEHNDLFEGKHGQISTITNHSGGIQGGISNGEHIYFNVAFKPVATLLQKQKSVNLSAENIELAGKGRHDACVVPRAVPIVEAMTALVLLDHYLLAKANKL